nr:hypothetical protein [Tanacetum cinerariifolium]
SAIAPPTRTDDRILPLRKWVPVGKSNYVVDVLRSQRNPIFKFVRKDGREVFGMPTPDAILTEHSIEDEEAVPEYPKATKVTKPKAAMQTKPSTPKATKDSKPAGDKTPKPTFSQLPKPKPATTKPSKEVIKKKRKLVKVTPDKPSPAKRSKGGLVGKRRKPKSPLKLVDEFSDEAVLITEPMIVDEEVDFQRGIELSLKDLEARNQGPASTVVIREPDSGRIQSLPETAEPTGPSSQPKDAWITMTNSETKSDEIVNPVNKEKDASNRELTEINAGVQDEGQAGSNPGIELSLKDLEARNQGPASTVVIREPDSGRIQSLLEVQMNPVNKEKDASNRELTEINAGVQDKGQAGSNPVKQDEGHARSNPGNAIVFQP